MKRTHYAGFYSSHGVVVNSIATLCVKISLRSKPPLVVTVSLSMNQISAAALDRMATMLQQRAQCVVRTSRYITNCGWHKIVAP